MMQRDGGPKTILYVENGIGYGGAVICLRHLVRNLDRSRYEPIVVTGRTGEAYCEIVNDAEWRYIPDHRLDVAGMRERMHKSTWASRLPLLRGIVNQLLSRADDLINFFPFFLRLLWLAKRRHVALVHANNEPLCNRAALLVGKLLGVPVVCHVRGEQKGSFLMKRFYRMPDCFLPVSRWISEGIGRLGIPESRRVVVYDGIPLDELDTAADGKVFRSEFGIPQESFAVGLVGLLIPWKGQELFLDAARILARKIPELCMIIVGGTPDDCRSYETHLRQRVMAEGLDKTIIFTGHMSSMEYVYNGLDVVVSASTTPEPLGTVVIETMAMGRPLVAPNHGGAAEMADHDAHALLFEPGNAEDLAGMIERLYRDKGLGERLGKAARAKALDTFSVEEHVKNVQRVYERFI